MKEEIFNPALTWSLSDKEIQDRKDRIIAKFAEIGATAIWRPQDGWKITKGTIHSWAIRDGYQIADLIDNRYQNHRPVGSLLEVFNYLQNHE